MTEMYHGSSVASDLCAAIGNTPLIRLKGASEETGCTILGKAEFMNPGGSVKECWWHTDGRCKGLYQSKAHG